MGYSSVVSAFFAGAIRAVHENPAQERHATGFRVTFVTSVESFHRVTLAARRVPFSIRLGACIA